MKEKRLLRLFGEIDDTFVAEAAGPGGYIQWLRWAAVAAAVVLAVGLAFLPWGGEDIPLNGGITTSDTDGTNVGGTTGTQNSTGTTTKKLATTTTNEQADSVLIIPHWEDMTVTQQYPEVNWGDAPYSIASPTVPKEQVGKRLGKTNITGYDVYTEKTYHSSVTVYRLSGIAQECAVAVQYEGHTDYHPARNAWYRPETLGQFITDLNLKEHIFFGTAHHDYFDKDKNYHSATSETAIAYDDIWRLLLSDATLKNVYDQQEMYLQDVSVAVDVPILGIQNLGLWTTEDGYLVTNILDTGKAFYIGKDKTKAFKDYITTHYTFTETVRGTTPTGGATDAPDDHTTTRASHAVMPGYNPHKQ